MYYQRVLVCIYGMSCWILYQSGLWLSLKSAGYLILICHAAVFFRSAVPTGQPIQLIYSGENWLLLTRQTMDELTEVKLRLNTGVFLLLSVRSARGRATYVIFFDQLSKSQWRRLMWLIGRAYA